MVRCKGKVTSQKAGAQSLGCADDSMLWFKCRLKIKPFSFSFGNLSAVNKEIREGSSSFGFIGMPYMWEIIAFRKAKSEYITTHTAAWFFASVSTVAQDPSSSSRRKVQVCEETAGAFHFKKLLWSFYEDLCLQYVWRDNWRNTPRRMSSTTHLPASGFITQG